MTTVMKVSAYTNPIKIAGALAGLIREQGKTEIMSVGAGALNQAIKAIAIARGFVADAAVKSLPRRLIVNTENKI